MSNLSVDDYKYFDSKFSEVHARIDAVDNDISKIKVEAESRLTEIETQHRLKKETTTSKKRDLFQIIGILGAYAMIMITVFL